MTRERTLTSALWYLVGLLIAAAVVVGLSVSAGVSAWNARMKPYPTSPPPVIVKTGPTK